MKLFEGYNWVYTTHVFLVAPMLILIPLAVMYKKEWNISDAWIKNSKGEKIIDFKLSNLHVVGYSTPIHKKVNLSELNNNIHYHLGKQSMVFVR